MTTTGELPRSRSLLLPFEGAVKHLCSTLPQKLEILTSKIMTRVSLSDNSISMIKFLSSQRRRDERFPTIIRLFPIRLFALLHFQDKYPPFWTLSQTCDVSREDVKLRFFKRLLTMKIDFSKFKKLQPMVNSDVLLITRQEHVEQLFHCYLSISPLFKRKDTNAVQVFKYALLVNSCVTEIFSSYQQSAVLRLGLF